MFNQIASYFTSTVGMALAGVTAALALTTAVQTYRVGAWENKYREAEEARKTETGQLQVDIGVQKTLMQEWKGKALEYSKEIEAANRLRQEKLQEIARLQYTSQEKNKTIAKYIKAIQEQKPSAGSNDCEESAVQLINLNKDRMQ
jgi:hypothetical protein